MAKEDNEFKITDSFSGYSTKVNKTKLSDGFLVEGSQNVVSTDGENIKVRLGYTIDGAANTALNPIESSFDWNTNTGDERNLRSYDDELEFRDLSSGSAVWTRVADGWSAVDFEFTTWWDTSEDIDVLLFVNGDDNIYAWSGCAALIGTTTANTIQLLDTTTTWAQERVFKNTGSLTYTKTVEINGTTYTYTGGETTDTLTGVSPDPSGEASGSLAIQNVTTFADAPGSDATTFSNDIISTLNNQVYVGSLINRNVFVSKNTDFTDFAFSSPRVPGEGATLVLDNAAVGFAPQEEKMYITAGKDDWYQTNFSLSDDNTKEFLSVQKLKTTAQEAAQSQALIGKIKNNIVYISNEPTLDTLGRLENVDTPQSKPISDPIKPDFDAATFTNGHIKYFKNNIYIAVPSDSKVYVFNIEKGFWESPLILPIRRLAIIAGELYGHSNAVPETYKLFDGHNDNTAPINAIAKFSFQNFGDRVALKEFDEFYSEGLISSNTKLKVFINYEFDGAESIQEFEIDGSDMKFLFEPVIDNSIGQNPLGNQPIGSTTDSASELSKFRKISTTVKQAFHEMQVVYQSEEVDENWELLAFGGNIVGSPAMPNSIKD